MAFAGSAYVTPVVIGSVYCWGDVRNASEITQALEDSGFLVSNWNGRSEIPPAHAAVHFLANSAALTGRKLEKIASEVTTALDSGVNVIVVKSARDASPGGLSGLRSRLARRGIRFAQDPNVGDAELQHRLRDLNIGGGEVRDCAFNATDVVRACHDRSRSIPELNSIAVTGTDRGDHIRLLRRSFGDCEGISVQQLRGGRAAAGVYRIIATSRARERWQPFVAKIAIRGDVIKEVRKFETRVRDFVPFANRPNGIPNRSFVLGRLGITVGQFAEQSEVLDSAIRRGTAERAIDDLLASVFRRWWANSHRAGPPVRTTLAALNLDRWYDPQRHENALERTELLAAYRDYADTTLRLNTAPLGQLQKRLSISREFRIGRIHGDLNAGNVLVRGPSALLIDYTHCTDGPLLADPTWLEVNLVFGWDWSGAGREAVLQHKAWVAGVDDLYRASSLNAQLPLHLGEDFPEPISRLFNAVRAIRFHALNMAGDATAYAHVLAAALVRWASLPPLGTTEKARQAATERAARAYAIATGIVNDTTVFH